MTVDKLNVKITAEVDDYLRNMKKAEDGTDRFGDGAENAANRAGEAFRSLKTGLVALGIGKFFKDAVNFAGDLEQNIGGAESVFKNYSSMIRDTAKEAAVSLGLAESDYLATATKMGALFQGTGLSAGKSADMTVKAMQRAADVASIMGISIDEAMYSITGAAKGNFTMMDNLGVAINDTTLQIYAQEKGLGKLETTQQKVNAAMQMFMDKTEYAAGNYAKENDTYAGSLNTLKAEFKNFMTEAGETLIPTATAGIKLLSGALQDVSPIVVTLGNGIGLIGDTLELVPEPLMKTATYALTAGIAFKKLNTILGVTGSKLALILSVVTFLIGKISQVYSEANEDLSSTANGADENISRADEAVQNLNDSLGDTKKVISSLAGFDEITKLSGGSTSLGSSIISNEDVERISSYNDEINNMLRNSDRNISLETDLDLSGATKRLDEFLSAVEEIGNNVNAALFGSEEEKYAALNRLNDYVKGIFGDEWSQSWEEVGADMYNIINGYMTGDENSIYSGWLDLNKKLEEIPFLGEIYKQSETFFNYFGQSMNALVSGDYDKVVELSLRMAANIPDNLTNIPGVPKLTDVQKVAVTDIANAIERGETGEQLDRTVNIAKDKMLKEAQGTLQSVTDFEEQASDFVFGQYLPVTDLVKGWNGFWYDVGADFEGLTNGESYKRGVQNQIHPIKPISLLGSYDSSWRHGANVNTGQLAEDFSSKAVYDAFTAANASSPGVIEIRTTVELDGDKIGESVTSYQNGVAYQQNGR